MKLISGCTSGGCGAKIGPGDLRQVLERLPTFKDPRLLVGFRGSDDAAAYRLDDTRSIICTADFFPPMVEDPLLFGRIAAANALSDIYAMGGEPLLALNLVCFPQNGDWAVLGEILRGGAEKVEEAGAVIGGGHSIYDHEPKYGLSVTGIVDISRILHNDTPRLGDRLILTKALGTGILLAAKKAAAADEGAYQGALKVMQRLNRNASRAMSGFHVSACTDVTGFGLLVHACEMAGEAATLRIDPDALPLQKNVLAYAAQNLTTAGGERNRNHLAGRVDMALLTAPVQEVLFDPQTSGGLLAAVDREEAEDLLHTIQQEDPEARIIGDVRPRDEQPVIFGGLSI
ncbi:MAG: selenide, water dikinase SelD [Clostridia bacterium]|nr:selenide, water dikinase SelD [Clostridia bacterium]